MEFITSRANLKVKALAALRQRKYRQEQGLALAEGLHLVTEALASPVEVASLVVAQCAVSSPAVATIINDARSRGVEIIALADDCYDKVSELESPEGVAVTIRVGELSIAPLLTGSARLLVADGVQDPGNAGALVRTAEAAGASGCVYLGGVDLSHPRFIRGAQGSSFRLACASATESEFIAAIAKTSIRLVVADAGQATDYASANCAPPVALVVGGEGHGVSPALLAAAHTRISIPMRAPVESLNVAVAAGILLYEARRHWR